MARALMTSRASALRAAPRLQRLVVPVGSIAAQSGAVIAQNRMLATIQGESVEMRVMEEEQTQGGSDGVLCINCATDTCFCRFLLFDWLRGSR